MDQGVHGFENAIWDDGEWVSWTEIDQQVQYKEWRAKYPNADSSLIPYFLELLDLAERYHRDTGGHLQVYGDIGELYGAITYGMRLNKQYAQGSDGRLGDDFIEVKTITPFKKHDAVEINLDRHFSKLLVVKINLDFEVSHRLVSREVLKKGTRSRLQVRWSDLNPE